MLRLTTAVLIAIAIPSCSGSNSDDQASLDEIQALDFPEGISEEVVHQLVVPDVCPTVEDLEECRDSLYEPLRNRQQFVAVRPGSRGAVLVLFVPPEVELSPDSVTALIDPNGQPYRAWISPDGLLIATNTPPDKPRFDTLIVDSLTCAEEPTGVPNSLFDCME